MQFTRDSHAAVADGSITVTIRLWKRPHAKVGGRYAVGSVVVEVDTIELMPFHAITDEDVRDAGAVDRDALRARAAHAGPIGDDTLVYRIEFHVIGAKSDPKPIPVDDDYIATIVVKLDRMDGRSAHGDWTRRVLQLIAGNPGTVSTELAPIAGRTRPEFKTDVRKLKALGLTESLETGYRLTAVGERVLDAAGRAADPPT